MAWQSLAELMCSMCSMRLCSPSSQISPSATSHGGLVGLVAGIVVVVLGGIVVVVVAGVVEVIGTYQIIVADAADAVSVNFSGRCKFFFSDLTRKIGNLLCILP